ncbi:MAG: RpiB/LacA/LacB family sugar-phosphate isomerase, partial [Desulfobulbales bacterium]|nr:RpiB/LacA/LacB family sugar-phosphate isomerase [Desulfobulbales bacterium]
AKSVTTLVLDGKCQCGILICGTGIGMSMVANRIPGIRAALCHEMFSAKMSREHNDANILCLGARVIGPGLAAAIVQTWMQSEFAGGRHQRRIDMF